MFGDQDHLDVNYSLRSAVREGRLERARELINSYGLSYSQGWSEGYVLLCDAIRYNHAAIVELLLTSGSRVNSINNMRSNTPLHFTVRNGDLKIVKMILDKGANIDAKDRFGRTPLHFAIMNKKMKVTELLLKHRADVNAGDDDDATPLHVAAEIGCLQTVEHLLKYGAIVDCVCTSGWRKGYAPLHYAVEEGNKEVVTLLLSRGANVDVIGEDSITPLHIAAKEGYTCIAKELLNHGACTNSLTLKERYTPLDFATKTEHETVVKLLFQHGANVDSQDKDIKTILHLAVEKGYLKIVEDVLRYSPDIYDKSKRSSLEIAVHSSGEEYKKIIEALLEYDLVNPQDKNNPELLHAAVEEGYLKIIEDLLKYGADVNTLYNSKYSKEGFTPLHSAAKYNREKVAKLLISYEADINAQDKNGKPPIFYAIENADFKITKLLLTNGANIKDSPELLNIAVKKECIEIVEALLQHDADININASDEYGRTALHYTASVSEYLFNEDPDSDIKRREIAKLLLSKGANVDAQTKDGVTTLHYAVKKRYVKVIEALLEYNANINVKQRDGTTALHLAIQFRHEEVVKVLLDCGAEVDAKIKDDITPLHLSAQSGYEEISIMLLNKGANANAKQKYGMTALHITTENGDEELVKVLLEFGADINSREQDGKTALHLASQIGNENIAVALLEYGADINITYEYYNGNNHTPLDEAMALMSYDPEAADYYDPYQGAIEATAETLKRHIVKIKTANLNYVSEKNLLLVKSSELIDFKDECEKEIASMKSEKINNLNTSFYDILAKGTSSLAIYMRNENIVQVLKSDDYKTKFPIYASVIESNFRKGMEKKELLEQGYKIFHFLFKNFPELPYNCTEKIFSYLSDKDIRILMDACTLGVCNPNTY